MVDFIHNLTDDQLSVFDNKYVIGVVGSRNLTDDKLVYANLTALINSLIKYHVISNWSSIIILSGKARGIDSIARQYAIDHNLTDVNILPDWKKYGKSAGFKRNYYIVYHSDRIIAFQKNNSRGTQNSINHAANLYIPCHVIKV